MGSPEEELLVFCGLGFFISLPYLFHSVFKKRGHAEVLGCEKVDGACGRCSVSEHGDLNRCKSCLWRKSFGSLKSVFSVTMGAASPLCVFLDVPFLPLVYC